MKCTVLVEVPLVRDGEEKTGASAGRLVLVLRVRTDVLCTNTGSREFEDEKGMCLREGVVVLTHASLDSASKSKAFQMPTLSTSSEYSWWTGCPSGSSA